MIGEIYPYDQPDVMSDYGRYVNPGLSSRLKMLRLDKTYFKGKGTCLWYQNEKGEEIKVLDFVGGYGAVLPGHNPDFVNEVQHQIVHDEIPDLVQFSIPKFASELGRWLNRRLSAPSKKCHFPGRRLSSPGLCPVFHARRPKSIFRLTVVK